MHFDSQKGRIRVCIGVPRINNIEIDIFAVLNQYLGIFYRFLRRQYYIIFKNHCDIIKLLCFYGACFIIGLL